MVEAERINKVALKIVKGLYFHHFSKPLPNGVEYTVTDESISLDVLIKIIEARKGLIGGEEGEFIYWFDDSDPLSSPWVLLFYLQNYLKVEIKNKQ